MTTKIKCKKCNSEIEGDGKGTLISCECEACYIDETPYYCRIGGDSKDILLLNQNGEYIEMNSCISKDKPERIDKTNYYLNIAEEVAKRSTCLKRHYGAIIVKNDEIISTGFNGAPRGINSCLEKGECLRADAERGKDYSNCLSVHAEQNAIISASRRDTLGSTLYLVGFLCDYFNSSSKELNYVENPAPCSLCKRMIINAGIDKVIVRTTKNEFIEFNTSLWKEPDLIGGY